MPVHVGVRDLKRRFVELREEAGKKTSPSHRLLLFYAVECGLKSAVLKRKRSGGTEDLDKDLCTHDLRRLIKELNLPPGVKGGLRPCTRRHNKNKTVDVQEVHQAWRYGACLVKEDEDRFAAALQEIAEWCQKEIGP